MNNKPLATISEVRTSESNGFALVFATVADANPAARKLANHFGVRVKSTRYSFSADCWQAFCKAFGTEVLA